MQMYKEAGALALGSRLRRLTDSFTQHAQQLYDLYQVDVDAKWFPVLYALWQKGPMSVTQVANYIGHSHASVSKTVKEMQKKEVVCTTRHPDDARISLLSLSDKGKAKLPAFESQCQDVAEVTQNLVDEAQHNLLLAIEEMEYLLEKQSFFARVQAKHQQNQSRQVKIVDFQPHHADAFKRLNYAWIEKYFEIEESDKASLEHPLEKIINPGGYIAIAEVDKKVVGSCALIKMDDTCLELAKMAVDENYQGLGLGIKLGQSVIEKAREMGAKRVYLESNTRLTPAIRLYHKLGFKTLPASSSPYARCDIQMELAL